MLAVTGPDYITQLQCPWGLKMGKLEDNKIFFFVENGGFAKDMTILWPWTRQQYALWSDQQTDRQKRNGHHKLYSDSD